MLDSSLGDEEAFLALSSASRKLTDGLAKVREAAGGPGPHHARCAPWPARRCRRRSPIRPTRPPAPQEVCIQGRISVPLSIGLLSNYLLSVISLSFVGHLSTAELAAASPPSTPCLQRSCWLACKCAGRGGVQKPCRLEASTREPPPPTPVPCPITPPLPLPPAPPHRLGASDTYASQAVGARNYAALGGMFKQAVLWLLAHTIPIAVVFVSLPAALRALGQPEDVCRLLGPYLIALLPGVWVEAFFRWGEVQPALGTAGTSRQRPPPAALQHAVRHARPRAAGPSTASWWHITLPQMWISCAVAVLHVPTTWFAVHRLGLGYVGAAYAPGLVLPARHCSGRRLRARLGPAPARVGLPQWGRVPCGPLRVALLTAP